MRKRHLLLIALLLLVGWLLWPRPTQRSEPSTPPPASTPAQAPATSVDSALPAFLPPEARATIELIQRGGPYPHRQDGSVFGNRESHLPAMPRGHYREYTVATPGLDHRGARRIVTGGEPPRTWYYSDDHYASFRAFAPAPAESMR